MFSGDICLYVCLQSNSEKLLIDFNKIFRNCRLWPTNNFGSDLVQEFLKDFRGVGLWWRLSCH